MCARVRVHHAQAQLPSLGTDGFETANTSDGQGTILRAHECQRAPPQEIEPVIGIEHA